MYYVFYNNDIVTGFLISNFPSESKYAVEVSEKEYQSLGGPTYFIEKTENLLKNVINTI